MATTYPKNLIPDFIELSELSDHSVLETEAEDGSSQRLTDELDGWKTSLKLSYAALTLEEVFLLVHFYHSVQGKYTWFRLPENVFSLDELYQERVEELVEDFRWKFKSPVSIKTEVNNLHNVDVFLEAVKIGYDIESVEPPDNDTKSGNRVRGLSTCRVEFTAYDIDYTAAKQENRDLEQCSISITAGNIDYVSNIKERTIDSTSITVTAYELTISTDKTATVESDECGTLKFKVIPVTTGKYRLKLKDGGWRLYMDFTGVLDIKMPEGVPAGWQVELVKHSTDEASYMVFEPADDALTTVRIIYSGGQTESGMMRAYGAVHILSMGKTAIPGDTELKWTFHVVGANAAVA